MSEVEYWIWFAFNTSITFFILYALNEKVALKFSHEYFNASLIQNYLICFRSVCSLPKWHLLWIFQFDSFLFSRLGTGNASFHFIRILDQF